MRWPLRNQILVPLTSVMLLVVAGASLLTAYLAAERSERQIAAQLNNIAGTLRSASIPLTDSVFRQMRGLSGAEFVLVDSLGNAAAASDQRLLPHLPLIGDATSGDSELGRSVQLLGARYFHRSIGGVTYPAQQVAPATLHIFYPEHFWREARWQAAWPSLAVGSAALLLVVALSLILAARIARPMRRLGQQVAGLAEGDFRPLALPDRDDEIRDLAGSVNRLATQLDELRQAIRRSERLAILGQLTGGLVHRLRNDVAGARIAMQLHERRCHADPESLRAALRQLAFTEEHLQRFLSAGAPSPLRPVELELHQVVSDVAQLVAPTCRHRKVDLQTTLAGSPIVLFADSDQLGQLLLNLVLNAIEAAGSGGWVRIELAGGAVGPLLRVWDSGPGPPEELAEKLFEPFVTGKPEGIGLGLAAVRQIAAAHGGAVRFSRNPATCFSVEIPWNSPPAAVPRTPPLQLLKVTSA